MLKPKIVIEISGNHGRSLGNCLELIRVAKQLKPDSIKLQCFDPEHLARKRLGHPAVTRALGAEQTLIELRTLYHRTHTPRDWWPHILHELDGYPWSCSVFSPDDLKFVCSRGCPQLKIASFELTDLELIRACNATGKPLVLSANADATIDEIDAALQAIDHPVTLLHATRYYDRECTDQEYKAEMERLFWLGTFGNDDVSIGLSDHTKGRKLITEWCSMVERHLKLPNVKTPDSTFSLDPDEMRSYMEVVRAYTKTSKQSRSC